MENHQLSLPDLSTAYIFKFEKMPANEVEHLMLHTAAYFEFYIPYETSKVRYVVGAVFSEQEVNNIKNYLELRDKELLAATVDELNAHQSLLGLECSYMKNVYHEPATV